MHTSQIPLLRRLPTPWDDGQCLRHIGRRDRRYPLCRKLPELLIASRLRHYNLPNKAESYQDTYGAGTTDNLSTLNTKRNPSRTTSNQRTPDNSGTVLSWTGPTTQTPNSSRDHLTILRCLASFSSGTMTQYSDLWRVANIATALRT